MEADRAEVAAALIHPVAYVTRCGHAIAAGSGPDESGYPELLREIIGRPVVI
jgi:hypothetical protein